MRRALPLPLPLHFAISNLSTPLPNFGSAVANGMRACSSSRAGGRGGEDGRKRERNRRRGSREERYAEQTLQLCGYAVRAVSVAGAETCIQLPALRLAFDIGRCPRAAVHCATVAFTHTHMDHIGGVGFHAATRVLRNLGAGRGGTTARHRTTYLVPHSDGARVTELLRALERVDRNEFEARVVPLQAGERHALDTGKGGGAYELVPFDTAHTVPSQGYLLVQRRRRLRREYAGLPGAEIGRLRRERGEEAVCEWYSASQVAVLGDTTIEGVLQAPEAVRRARLLVTEITGLDGDGADGALTAAACAAHGHTHIDDVVRHADAFRDNERVLFVHFSARYTAARIRQALDERLPRELRDKAVALVGDRRHDDDDDDG